MNPYNIIEKYYADNAKLRELLLVHSRLVTKKALQVSSKHPELAIDNEFVKEAGMLHDIGIVFTDAPSIYCYGKEPYLCHGILGAKIMRDEGYPLHARVCERHTGAGLTCQDIIRQGLPLPHRDFLPETMEEKLVCYADKFYSKTHLTEEKPIENVIASLQRFGADGVERFKEWHRLFG